MRSHDSALTHIATETELIVTRSPFAQPAGVDWDRIQPDQFTSIPFLGALPDRLLAGKSRS